MYTKIIGVVLLLASLVVGCASTPRSNPAMSDETYKAFAKAFNTIEACHLSGYFNTDIAAQGTIQIKETLGMWNYIPSKLNSEITNTVVSVNSPLCNKMALGIREESLKKEENRKNIAASNQADQQPVYAPPRSTFCNRVGTQLLCSSF